eukprot:gene18519-21081_t
MQIGFVLILLVVLGMCVVDAKKMWGSRKKRDDGDSGIVTPPRAVPKPSSRRATVNKRKLNMDEFGESFDAGSLNEMFTKYLDTFEESLDTIDFTSLVNPEQIRQLIAHVPGAAESPEVSAMLSILETSDAETLRNLAREGVSTMRGAKDEVIDFLTSPEKIAQLLSQLPPEMREVVKALQTGDTTLLKNIIINQPDLEASQKTFMLNLLDGNIDSISRELKKVLSDNTQVEAARQQLLEHPELAEAFGVDAELLQDSKKWAKKMAESADTLFTQLDEAQVGQEGEMPTAGDTLRAKLNSLKNLKSELSEGEEERVEDFLKKFKSKIGRAL